MHNSKAAIGFLILRRAKSFSSNTHSFLLSSYSSSSSTFYSSRARTLLLLLSSYSSSSAISRSGFGFLIPKRAFSGYAAEQFSDDEYDCDFDSHQVFFFFQFFELIILLFVIDYVLFGCRENWVKIGEFYLCWSLIIELKLWWWLCMFRVFFILFYCSIGFRAWKCYIDVR